MKGPIVEEEVRLMQTLVGIIISNLRPLLQPLLVSPSLSPSKTSLSPLRSLIESFISQHSEKTELKWNEIEWLSKWLKQTEREVGGLESAYSSLESKLFPNGPKSSSTSSLKLEIRSISNLIDEFLVSNNLIDPFSSESLKMKSRISNSMNSSLRSFYQSIKPSQKSDADSELFKFEEELITTGKGCIALREAESKDETLLEISKIISAISTNSSPLNATQKLPNLHLVHSLSKRLHNNLREYDRLNRKLCSLLSQEIQIVAEKHHHSSSMDSHQSFFLNFYRSQIEQSISQAEETTINSTTTNSTTTTTMTPQKRNEQNKEEGGLLGELNRLSVELRKLNSSLFPQFEELDQLSESLQSSFSVENQLKQLQQEKEKQKKAEEEEEELLDEEDEGEEEEELERNDEEGNEEREEREEGDVLQQERRLSETDKNNNNQQQEIDLKRLRTQYALGILSRIKSKLEGKDEQLLSDQNQQQHKLTVSQVVDLLVKQATSLDNLAVLFEGMTAWV